jgi:hypothetical protein
MRTPRLREIQTYDDAIEALGGTSKAARLLGRSPQEICQYRERYQAFPMDLFFRVGKRLQQEAPDNGFSSDIVPGLFVARWRRRRSKTEAVQHRVD